MSAVTAEAESGGFVCANCGAAGVDEIKVLEVCTACQSARYYCSDKCREEDQELHSEGCENREAELHDKKLMQQPDETHLGECPLCFLPLGKQKSTFKSCCSKIICEGCVYANHISNGDRRCPFCREPRPKEKGEIRRRKMKRVKANDPAALSHMGRQRYKEGDYDGAFEYLTKAAELGNAAAHCQLGVMYWKGHGVEKDEEKKIHHYEKAAIGGHPGTRHALALIEEKRGNIERSVKHFVIAANLGFEISMKELWGRYSRGHITKEELEATLRTHQAALDEMKSPQRDAAAAAAV